MLLSVVIASHSDSDLPNTLESLRSTASGVEIWVVDDASVRPVASEHAGVIRTAKRIGVGPARHLGAMHATGEYLLLTDSHMRFFPGWYDLAMSRLVGRPKTIHCGSCHDFGTPDKPYYGARWNFYGSDAKHPRIKQILECVWAPKVDADDYPIQAIMGAIYFIPREWFFKLNPLRYLHSWGCDEQSLSLKTWLAGGEIKMLTSVKAAHRFQDGNQPYPIRFKLNPADTWYNKMFLMHTILPADKANILLTKLPRDRFSREAAARITADWGLIEIEREYNRRLFTRSFDSYLQQFNIPFPDK